MLFNSLDFAIFLPVVFTLYWFVFNKNLAYQNILILLSSYIFYGWWDWRFLSLILISTIFDFLIGIQISNQNNIKLKKLLLWISVFVNLSLLGFFKYYNFFLDNFINAFSFFGMSINAKSFNIILPVGISFYTFQTLSYSIDVYRNKLKPTTNFIAYSAFVSFFPQLVAGPIERATNLLPQFYSKRSFDRSNAVLGMRQIIWGLLKKIVIADNCAKLVETIFSNTNSFSGSVLILGALFFTFQIYCDFSGYSDIAIGTAKLFGFQLMQNFKFPYFSRDMAEFWRRWHISLSSWFKDYLYIPLGGSFGNAWLKIRNIFIVFIVSGFWHGANWTFIVWGALNALYYLPLLLTKKNRTNLEQVAKGRLLPSFREILSIGITFCLTMFAWIFFRAESITHAINYIFNIFSNNFFFSDSELYGMDNIFGTTILIVIFYFIEWMGRDQEFAIYRIPGNKFSRYTIYYIIIFCIFYFGNFGTNEFIYFQF